MIDIQLINYGQFWSSYCFGAKPHEYASYHFVIGFDNERDVAFYNFELGTWQSRSPIPKYSCGASAVCLNEKIVVVGGSERAWYSYDPCTDVWMQLQSPSFMHDRGAAVVLNSKIMLCGGGDTNCISEYDAQRNVWVEVQLKVPCRKPCYMNCALAFNI